MNLRAVGAAAGLLVTALVSGCSGSGTSKLSHDAFLSKAEAICQATEDAGHALPQPASPKDLPAYMHASIALTKKTQSQLVGLAARTDDRAYIDKIFLDAMQKQITAVESALPQIVKDSAAGRTDTLDKLALPQADLHSMRIYGLTECARVVGSA